MCVCVQSAAISGRTTVVGSLKVLTQRPDRCDGFQSNRRIFYFFLFESTPPPSLCDIHDPPHAAG